MATKEDILEQIVEEYLVHKGYFVQHNLKFLPRKDHPDFISNKDSNHSDIDVIGYCFLPFQRKDHTIKPWDQTTNTKLNGRRSTADPFQKNRVNNAIS